MGGARVAMLAAIAVSSHAWVQSTSSALHARNAEYNPKRFAAVIMRIREPKTTALIFKSVSYTHLTLPTKA